MSVTVWANARPLGNGDPSQLSIIELGPGTAMCYGIEMHEILNADAHEFIGDRIQLVKDNVALTAPGNRNAERRPATPKELNHQCVAGAVIGDDELIQIELR